RSFTVSLPQSAGLAAEGTPSPAVAPAPTSRRNRYLVPLAFSAGFVLGAGWHHLISSPLGKVSNASGNAPATPLPASPMPAGKSVAIDRSIALASEATATPPTPAPSNSPVPSNSLESAEVVADLAAAKPTQTVLTLKAVGDIILGTNFPGDRLPADAQSLFENVKPFFEGADILFGNFESTLTDYPYTAKDTSRGQTFAFRTPPSYASVLQQVGFDVLSVANNHSFDFGDQGFADTIANIQNAGMQAVGRKGDIIYQKVNGITVAFIGFSYLPDHNTMQDLAAAKALVDEANRNANIVVISVHAGAEGTDAVHTKNETEYFFGEDRGNLVEFAHAMIDQGADLILGHGPHVPRAMELYKSRLIAYSLGNFVGYRTLSTEGTLSYSLILQAQLDAQGGFIEGKVIPVRLDAQGVPYLDDYFQSVALVRNLIESDFPVTPLLIGNDGKIIKNEAP
ncbi:MAG TPA: CapA family protein, partial [Allocoleopsis sp.]